MIVFVTFTRQSILKSAKTFHLWTHWHGNHRFFARRTYSFFAHSVYSRGVLNQQSYALGVLYHPPRPLHKTDDFVDWLHSDISELVATHRDSVLLLVGDLNKLECTKFAADYGLLKLLMLSFVVFILGICAGQLSWFIKMFCCYCFCRFWS